MGKELAYLLALLVCGWCAINFGAVALVFVIIGPVELAKLEAEWKGYSVREKVGAVVATALRGVWEIAAGMREGWDQEGGEERRNGTDG